MTGAEYKKITIPNHLRKAVIFGFIVFHFAAVLFWLFAPYCDLVVSEPISSNPIRRFERSAFKWLAGIKRENNTIQSVLTDYIDVIGAHQYWDFFAPEAPTVHRYIQVCRDITLDSQGPFIHCIDPIYKSFRGELADAVRSFDGKDSRHFRFAESLIRLDREDLYQAFTEYWHRVLVRQHGSGHLNSYLLMSGFPLDPWRSGLYAQEVTNRRTDRILWITSK